MKTIPFILAASLYLGGCSSVKNMATAFVGNKVGVPVEAKTVASKSGPTTLMASDRTTCNVSAEKFQKITVGDLIACLWSDRSEGLPPGVGAPGTHSGSSHERGRMR